LTDVPTVTICCEICRRPVLVATVRIAPSIRQTGWRCARPACAPGNDEAPVQRAGAPVNNNTINTTATAFESGGHDDFTP
jgi:hypothetical protein